MTKTSSKWLMALMVLFGATARAAMPVAPEWLPELVIYEIMPRTFTSPNGPGSGTFESLQAKLPYLQELGITGIWLAGHALSDPHHFYNIWSGYGTIAPDRLDPVLGTREQFRSLIAEAHHRGIKIFLDVTTHGVTAQSPLIRQHPEWFRGGTWGMIDYDWYGGHTDLDDWWVQTWTDYVVNDGIDGFRLDVNMYRPDLWARIRRSATDARHPIAIFEETNAVLPGVTDFVQQDMLSFSDIPGYFDRLFGRAGIYTVKIQFKDGSAMEGGSDGHGPLHVHLAGLAEDRISRRLGDYVGIDPYVKADVKTAAGVPRADGIPDIRLTVDNIADKEIQNILVEDDIEQKWSFHGSVSFMLDAPLGFWVWPLAVEGDGPQRQLSLATLARGYRSLAVNSHDGNDKSGPKGSRAKFGALFFTPALPLFVGGDEFNANFHALPDLSPDVFGGKNPGKGVWLYGSMLDWGELQDPSHRDMLEDVKKMIAIRKREWAILAPPPAFEEPALMATPYASDITVPKPYMRWKDGVALIVLTNEDIAHDAHLKLRIPLERLGESAHAKYRVTDLWRGGRPAIHSAEELRNFSCTIRKDKVSGGGIALIKVERVN